MPLPPPSLAPSGGRLLLKIDCIDCGIGFGLKFDGAAVLHNNGKTERKIQITQRRLRLRLRQQWRGRQSDHEFPAFNRANERREEAASAKCDKRTDGRTTGALRRLCALPS